MYESGKEDKICYLFSKTLYDPPLGKQYSKSFPFHKISNVIVGLILHRAVSMCLQCLLEVHVCGGKQKRNTVLTRAVCECLSLDWPRSWPQIWHIQLRSKNVMDRFKVSVFIWLQIYFIK